jgi:hypothetical protein
MDVSDLLAITFENKGYQMGQTKKIDLKKQCSLLPL